MSLTYLLDEPEQPCDSAIIWLHGLGASANDLQPLMPLLRRQPGLAGLRGILPQAPMRPVTINGGLAMPAWYDILAATPERVINQQHLLEAAAQVQALVDTCELPPERIVIAGFSQGGAVAYQAALTSTVTVTGLVCLSTYLGSKPDAPRQDIPLLAMHGSLDEVVPESLGLNSADWCRQQGLTVDYQSYPQGHEIGISQIKDLARWLATRLTPLQPAP
jgi:phospholipase/carboxylesterase